MGHTLGARLGRGADQTAGKKMSQYLLQNLKTSSGFIVDLVDAF